MSRALQKATATMDEPEKKTIWPDDFPISRALIALLLIPLISNLMLFLFMNLWNLAHSPRPSVPNLLSAPGDLGEMLVFAILTSVPGYIAFAALGIPILFILHRLNWSGFILFAVIGALCTFIAWLVFTRGMPGTAVRMPRLAVWQEFKAFGFIGAINGILTRLIVLGSRRSL